DRFGAPGSGLHRRRVPDGLPQDPRAVLEASRICRRQELGGRQEIRRRAGRSVDERRRRTRSGGVIGPTRWRSLLCPLTQGERAREARAVVLLQKQRKKNAMTRFALALLAVT